MNGFGLDIMPEDIKSHFAYNFFAFCQNQQKNEAPWYSIYNILMKCSVLFTNMKFKNATSCRSQMERSKQQQNKKVYMRYSKYSIKSLEYKKILRFFRLSRCFGKSFFLLLWIFILLFVFDIFCLMKIFEGNRVWNADVWICFGRHMLFTLSKSNRC